MVTVEIRSLVARHLDAVGVDARIIVEEQALDSAVRYVARLDGDDAFTGEGATPYEAIEDYERKISAKGATVKNAGGDVTLTLDTDGKGSVVALASK
jgi:hypothetical protein